MWNEPQQTNVYTALTDTALHQRNYFKCIPFEQVQPPYLELQKLDLWVVWPSPTLPFDSGCQMTLQLSQLWPIKKHNEDLLDMIRQFVLTFCLFITCILISIWSLISSKIHDSFPAMLLRGKRQTQTLVTNESIGSTTSLVADIMNSSHVVFRLFSNSCKLLAWMEVRYRPIMLIQWSIHRKWTPKWQQIKTKPCSEILSNGESWHYHCKKGRP